MEDGDREKYHTSRVIQDFVFSIRKGGCIRCISLQVYNKVEYCTSNSLCNNSDLLGFVSFIISSIYNMHWKILLFRNFVSVGCKQLHRILNNQ